ncbi:MAG: cytochrome b/b6 domain-containing protein [Spirochaetia bacterium]|nr:cytochrome b/b6 domain-containing protein [Spirochaetia bacterium]
MIKSYKLIIYLFLFVNPIVISNAQSNKMSDSECFECHEVTVAKKSAHSKVRCQKCHNDIKSDDHESAKPVKCMRCHEAARQFVSSDHGRAVSKYTGKKGFPVCKICHEQNAHKIYSKDHKKSTVHRTKIEKTCGSCHEKKEVMSKFVLKPKPLESYDKTIHGKAFSEGNLDAATCTDCHGSHENQRRSHHESLIAVQNISKTCGKCHKDERVAYEKSTHGISAAKGIREVPLCITCHGEHDIQSAETIGGKGELCKEDIVNGKRSIDDKLSIKEKRCLEEKNVENAKELDKTGIAISQEKKKRTPKKSITNLCGECHATERIARKFNFPMDRLSSYRSSYHGTMDKLGDKQVADCASCHGYHLILPADHKDSTIHESNLPKTCGECHEGAGATISVGNVHMNPTHVEGGVVYWVRNIWLWLIICTLSFMFLHNVLDYGKKLKIHYIENKAKAVHQRLNVFERIQHFMLAFSFIGLAWTGFAFVYPDSILAYPFSLFANGLEIRWWGHRIFALILVITSIMHAIYAIFTRKGRKEIPGMLPRYKDLKDMIGLVSYNLGFRKERPKMGRHNYIDKMEYLAVIWGTVLMIITGGILTFDDFSVKYLSMVAINISTVIHLYEAILATLAIIIWHLYWVVYDPAEYPMRFSWLTGKITKKTKENMHAEDSENEKDSKKDLRSNK